MSSLARAEIIIDKDRILLVPSRQTWLVQGSSGTEYAVQLFRKGGYDPICPCPATTTNCCHILACLKSIGLDPAVSVSMKKRNTRQLLNNCKAVNSRRTGQKTPNPTVRKQLKDAKLAMSNEQEAEFIRMGEDSTYDCEEVILILLKLF